MANNIEHVRNEYEDSTLLSKVLSIKKENIFVEDGPTNIEPDCSFKTSTEIKKETIENSGYNYSDADQGPNFLRVDIKEEVVEDIAEIDNVAFDEESNSRNEENEATPESATLTCRKPSNRPYSALRKNKTMRCPSCQYTSNKLDNLKKHLLIHSSNKQLHCEKCDYKCHWKSWMDRHERKHEDNHETPYICDRCDYQTRWKSCMERHALKHDMLKPYACLVCSYAARTKGDLRMHTMVHSEVKRHKCQSCPYSTARRQNLLIHIKNYHTEGASATGIKDRRRRGNIAINESEIRITTATGFRCPHCTYTCGTKPNIKRHIGRHFNKPEFPCDHCSYKSHRKDYLKSHMLTHSRIKAFGCTQCSFTCSWNSALRRHMLTHLDERPFQCNDCEFKSSDKSNLKRHVRGHLEIRLLLCSFCDVYFPALENLVIHKKIIHKRDITGFLS